MHRHLNGLKTAMPVDREQLRVEALSKDDPITRRDRGDSALQRREGIARRAASRGLRESNDPHRGHSIDLDRRLDAEVVGYVLVVTVGEANTPIDDLCAAMR